MTLLAVDIAAFWSFVDKDSDPNGHWLWLGWVDSGGYGIFKTKGGKLLKAHRVLWRLVKKRLPKDKMVLHKCPSGSVRNCLCPDHLYLGTAKQNADDRAREGRYINPIAGHPELCSRGEHHWTRTKPERMKPAKGDSHWTRHSPQKVVRGSKLPHAKLTAKKVRDIRKLYGTGKHTLAYVAGIYDVSEATISLVCAYKIWKHVI